MTSVDDILFEDGLDFNKVFVVNGKVEKASVVVDVIKVSDVDKDVVEVASVVAAEDVEVVAKLVIVDVEVDDVVAKVVKVICGFVGKFIVVELVVWLDFIVVCGDAEVILIGPPVVIITGKVVVVASVVWLDFIVVCSDVEDKVLLIGPAVLTTSLTFTTDWKFLWHMFAIFTGRLFNSQS